MERFTKKVDGVWTALCNYGSSPYPVVTQEIIDRLAAYEDTGFTPEEVQVMRWNECGGVGGSRILMESTLCRKDIIVAQNAVAEDT